MRFRMICDISLNESTRKHINILLSCLAKEIIIFCKIKYHFKTYQHMSRGSFSKSLLWAYTYIYIYIYGKLEYPLLRQLIDSLVVGRDRFSLQ